MVNRDNPPRKQTPKMAVVKKAYCSGGNNEWIQLSSSTSIKGRTETQKK